MKLNRSIATLSVAAVLSAGIIAPQASAQTTTANGIPCTFTDLNNTELTTQEALACVNSESTPKEYSDGDTEGNTTEKLTNVTVNGESLSSNGNSSTSSTSSLSSGPSESTWAIVVAGLVLLGTVAGVAWPVIQKALNF